MYEIFAKLLNKKGLKAVDVTRATGVSSTVFSEWKKGKSTPKLDKMQKIADFLGVSVDYLTGTESRIADTLSNIEKEQLAALFDQYPAESASTIAKLCKKERVKRDLTERTVASDVNIPLEEYFKFENDFKIIEIEKIIDIIIYFNLNIGYVTGFLTGRLIMDKTSDEATEILGNLLPEEEFKKEVLELQQIGINKDSGKLEEIRKKVKVLNEMIELLEKNN